MKKKSLSEFLKKPQPKSPANGELKKAIEEVQLKLLRIQQGAWHSKERVIIMLEGFDAAGKGGLIRKITENLDPRGLRVHPIGPPNEIEQGKHWLYRFWKLLPAKGDLAIFDRSWYGRVLVERVDKIAKKEDWMRAYEEINEFERQLVNDGIHVIKIFLAISKKEQLKRFEDRLNDPYKQWKITEDDLHARRHWNDYVIAMDDVFAKTDTKIAPWHLIGADNKSQARLAALTLIEKQLHPLELWIEKRAKVLGKRDLKKELALLEKEAILLK